MTDLTHRQVREILLLSAEQLEPHLSNLERALERSIDPESFALGMMAAGFAMSQVDIVKTAESYRAEFEAFLVKVRERVERDLGAYQKGSLATGYYRPDAHVSYPRGTEVHWRKVDERYVEVRFPTGETYWLYAEQVE